MRIGLCVSLPPLLVGYLLGLPPLLDDHFIDLPPPLYIGHLVSLSLPLLVGAKLLGCFGVIIGVVLVLDLGGNARVVRPVNTIAWYVMCAQVSPDPVSGHPPQQ